jgi:hypothetical protein
MSFVDAIGLVGASLGIIGFMQANIPGDPPPQGAKIRVKAGNPGDDNPGLVSNILQDLTHISAATNIFFQDGNVEAAYAWDINNNYLGPYPRFYHSE